MQLQFAERNERASPMRWLQQRLEYLKATVRSGTVVEVVVPNGTVRLAMVEEFDVWCTQSFPDEDDCFFKSAARHNG